MADHQTVEAVCSDCGENYRRVTGYVHLRGGGTAASFSANCRPHPHHDVALDLTLGSWGGDGPADDHETFSCWIEPPPSGATLTDPLLTMSAQALEGDDAWLLGRPIGREQALQDPRLPDIWTIVDALVAGVPHIRRITAPTLRDIWASRRRGGATHPAVHH